MNNLGQWGGGGGRGKPTLFPPHTPQTYNEAFSLNKRKTSWSNHGKSQHLRKLYGRHVHIFSEIFCMHEIFHNFYEVYKWWKRNETMTLKTRIESDEDLNMQKQVPLGHRCGGGQGETLLPTSLSTHLVVFPGVIHHLVRGPFSSPAWGCFWDPPTTCSNHHTNSDNKDWRLNWGYEESASLSN